jgi:hypothetical protein
MQRVSLKAFIILVTVVSIYLYFFPPTKKNKFHAALQKNIAPLFGTWQLSNDTSTLILVLSKDTTYVLTQIKNILKDTASDTGKFIVDEFGIKDNTGYGFLTLQTKSHLTFTYEMQVYKMKQLELIDRETRLLTKFTKQ